jgi:DNA-binding transcriptional MerR regulator
MLLIVGELARRTGLTVRALHHHDRVGLLLADVARLLDGEDGGDGVTLPAILSRHIGALAHYFARRKDRLRTGAAVRIMCANV